MMACKKRVDLSIDDKLKVLETLKTPGGAIMKVADHSDISASQVGRIKQSKESLTQLQHSPSILGKTRKKRCWRYFFHTPRKSEKPALSGNEVLSPNFPIKRV